MSPGKYLYLTGSIYLLAGLYVIFFRGKNLYPLMDYVAFTWIIMLIMPFFIKPFGKWVGVKSIYDWSKKNGQ